MTRASSSCPHRTNIGLALCVFIDAGGMDQGCFARQKRLLDTFDEPAALSEMNDLPGLG